MSEELVGTVLSIIYESADGYTVAEIEADEPAIEMCIRDSHNGGRTDGVQRSGAGIAGAVRIRSCV